MILTEKEKETLMKVLQKENKTDLIETIDISFKMIQELQQTSIVICKALREQDELNRILSKEIDELKLIMSEWR